MNTDVAKIVECLRQDVRWLHFKMNTYRELYGSEEHVSLLNEQAPVFFYVIQDILGDDIQLSLARLTDRPSVGGKANLSLECLVEAIDPVVYPELAATVQHHLEAVRRLCDPIRVRRHRVLAHRDFDTAMGRAEPLGTVTIQAIDDALFHIRAFMNAVESHLFGKGMLYEMSQSFGNTDAVQQLLHDAKSYRELRDTVYDAGGSFIDWHDMEGVARLIMKGAGHSLRSE
jgi:hypothetical protein